MLWHEVAAIRIKLGLTQMDMAEKMGVSERTFARWERNEQPVPEIAAKLMARMEEDE